MWSKVEVMATQTITIRVSPEAARVYNTATAEQQRELEAFLVAFVERVLFIEPTEEVRACRDAKDDKFLELAVSGRAAYIISGDDDLLALHPFRDIAIMTAAEFLQATEEEATEEKA